MGMPLVSPIATYLEQLHERYRSLDAGQVADYIPELAKADPNWFGMAIATCDGHLYEVGDTQIAFTIQSIAKVFTYALALQDRDEPAILARIGVEPSGEAFNAISLRPDSGVPFNPMINAGAIATCGQVLGCGGATRIERILEYLSQCAGRSLDIDQAVYESERQTGHRNRAIAWMLRNFNILEEDPDEILTTYFQQSAIRVTCRDLALMGATLANEGVHPRTGRAAIQAREVDNLLSIMATCGMYDYSGEWLYRVGLPAKSGVGGGIIAVLPGQLGIGVFSPPLDAQGNPLRGIRVCADMAHDLNLHVFNPAAVPSSPGVRRRYNASQVTCTYRRTPTALEILQTHGQRIQVWELQGQLTFARVELVIRQLLTQAVDCDYGILDFSRVTEADRVSLDLLVRTGQGLRTATPFMAVTYSCGGVLASQLLEVGADPETVFPSLGIALERAEDQLLTATGGSQWQPPLRVELAASTLVRECHPEDVAWLDACLPTRHYEPGTPILLAGERGWEVFFIVTGAVEVRLPETEVYAERRVDRFTAGMSFGEMAFWDQSHRSASVIALMPVECRVLDHDRFTAMERERPRAKIALLLALGRQVIANLRRANRELAVMRS